MWLLDDCMLNIQLYNLGETHFINLFFYKDMFIMRARCIIILVCIGSLLEIVRDTEIFFEHNF